jgi:hypothetical protein
LVYTGAVSRRRIGRFYAQHPDATILAILLALGALIRLAFLFRSPVFYVGGDSQTYLLPAYELVHEGDWDLGNRRPPLYPLFLAAVMFLFGEDTRAISFVQHALGLATIAAAYALGRVAANRAVGIFAGLSVALSGPLLVYEHYVMSEALFTILATLVALACLRLRAGARPMLAIVCGLLIGLSWLTRPAGLLLAPLIPLALLGQVSFRRLCALSSAALAGLAIVAVPWLVALAVLHGSPSVLGVGNNLIWRVTRNDIVLILPRDNIQPQQSDPAAAQKRYVLDQARRKELPDDIADGLERRFGLSELQSDRLLAETALEIIAAKPILYLQTTAEITADLFIGTEQYLGGQGKEGGVERFSNPQEKYQSWWNPKVSHIPQPPLATEAAEFGRARAIVGLLQPYRLAGLLAVLCLAGVLAGLVSPRYRSGLILAIAVISGLVGAAALSGATPRFRYPYDPMIWTLAGIGVTATVDFVRRLAGFRVPAGSAASENAPAT